MELEHPGHKDEYYLIGARGVDTPVYLVWDENDLKTRTRVKQHRVQITRELFNKKKSEEPKNG